MFILNISAVLLVFVCSNHFQYGHGTMQVVTRSHVLDKGIFFANRYSFNKGNLVYVLCHSNSMETIKCKVVHENYPYKGVARSCPVTLENNRNQGFLTVVVAALGKDKAILIWKYKDSHHSTIVTIGTINLQTCRMNNVKIPNADLSVLLELYYKTKFVSYDDDSFDIFYNDPRSQGVDAPLYKMEIDDVGHMRSQPRIVNIERGRYLFVSPVATGSSSKGHIYERKNLMDLSSIPTYFLWLVKSDGTRKHLAEFNGFPRSDVSADNNFISLCHKPRPAPEPVTEPVQTKPAYGPIPEIEPETMTEPEPKTKSDIMCTQYDEDGNVLFRTNISDTSYKIDTLTTYNLLDGGMLIMYGGKKRNQEERYGKETVFEVVRIDSDGTKIGSLITQQLEIPLGTVRNSYIYKNGNKGYCATVLLTNASLSDSSLKMEEEPMYLTIYASCFNEYDFIIWN